MFNLKALARAALAAAIALSATAVAAQEDDEEAAEAARLAENAKTYWRGPTLPRANPNVQMVPTRPKENYTPNTFSPSISAEAKMNFMQSMMSINPFSLRDMINMMVVKKRADPTLSFDEVVESLQLKANELNMRAVSHTTPYKILREIDKPDSPRVEFFSFCDLITMRRIVDYVPEFIAFLPCRVAVMEDAEGQIWIVSLDWDVRWLDTSPNPNRISEDLRDRAISVRERIEEIMEAAANGDL